MLYAANGPFKGVRASRTTPKVYESERSRRMRLADALRRTHSSILSAHL